MKKVILIALILIFAFSISAFAADYGVVNTDVLNFRMGPGTGYGLVGQLVKGQTVQVVEYTNNEWVKVSFNSKTGYVSSKYLDIRKETLTDRGDASGRPVSGESCYVTANALNFRSSAEIGNNVISTLPKYSQATLVSDLGNGWYIINYNGVEGYVSSSYIAKGQAPHPVVTAGQNVVEYAKAFLGKPYVYGGNGPNSFDCSGFTKYVFKQFGVNIERTAHTQMNSGYYVSKDALQPGDLVFFKNGGSVNHVGIYVGNGQMIHASSPGDVVKYDTIMSGYYNTYYYTARRVL